MFPDLPAELTWCSDCGNKVESTLSLRDWRESSRSGLRAPEPCLETLPGNNKDMLDLKKKSSQLFLSWLVISPKIFVRNDSKQTNTAFVSYRGKLR